MRRNHFEPAFLFQGLQYVDRLFLVRKLLHLMTQRAIRDVLDVIVFFGRVIARLGALFQRPVKTRGQTRGPDQAGRIFIESVIMQHAKHFGFDIGHAVERIRKQSTGARIQRQSHGVHGKVAPAHVVINGARRNLSRLARLVIPFRARTGHFRAHVSRQQKQNGARVLVRAFDYGTGLFKILLQLKGVALDGEIQVANDESADDVAHSAAGEINVHLM